MCQIIVKPQYYSMPPDEHIVNSYNNNPDGFGLAYWEEGMKAVHIRKGAMSIKGIFKMLDNIPSAFNKAIVMHFRFATEGDICPANCHPFPITASVPQLQALNLDCKQAIAHNGIILDFRVRQYNDIAGYWEPGDPDCPKPFELSDTQEFILNYLAGCGKALYNKGVQKMIEAFTDSKFAVLTIGGKIDFIGEFTKDKGLYYSSLSYLWNNVYTPPKKADVKVTGVYNQTLRYDKKTGTWVNPAYHPDADFEDTPVRYGFCESCKTWAKLTELEETWICLSCREFYTAKRGV